MKKLFLIGFILITKFSFSQGLPQLTRTFPFTSATASTSVSVIGLGLSYYKLKWELLNGSSSVCTVGLQGAPDNVTWTNIIANKI